MDAKKAAAVQRLRTQPRSRLTKIDLVRMLSRPEAWISLPIEVRERLYTLLPPPFAGEPARDPELHPFHTSASRHFRRACVKWQQELEAGFHTKVHRSHVIERADMPGARKQATTTAAPVVKEDADELS